MACFHATYFCDNHNQVVAVTTNWRFRQALGLKRLSMVFVVTPIMSMSQTQGWIFSQKQVTTWQVGGTELKKKEGAQHFISPYYTVMSGCELNTFASSHWFGRPVVHTKPTSYDAQMTWGCISDVNKTSLVCGWTLDQLYDCSTVFIQVTQPHMWEVTTLHKRKKTASVKGK